MERSILKWAAVPAALLAMACGSEGPDASNTMPTGNRASGETSSPAVNPEMQAPSPQARSGSGPIIESIQLSPSSASAGDRVYAEVAASDPDGDPIRFEYRWAVNGRPAGDGRESFVLEDAGRGRKVSVSVTASDGQNQSPPMIAEMTLGNSAPELTGIRFEPVGELLANQSIAAVPEANDPDGDALTYDFTWYVNGRRIFEDGPTLNGTEIRRGDRIELSVRASDGQTESDELRSDSIEVSNSAPEITSQPGAIGPDGVFRYAIKANDPDGDRAFMYRLKQGPSSMQVDVLGGEVTWRPVESQAGPHSVEVEVDDRMGGVAVQSFTLNVQFEGAPPASTR